METQMKAVRSAAVAEFRGALERASRERAALERYGAGVSLSVGAPSRDV